MRKSFALEKVEKESEECTRRATICKQRKTPSSGNYMTWKSSMTVSVCVCQISREK